MPSPVEVIAARLTRTGVSPEIAVRLAIIIAGDLYRSGFAVVRAVQLDLMFSELAELATDLRVLSDATTMLETISQRPREHHDAIDI